MKKQVPEHIADMMNSSDTEMRELGLKLAIEMGCKLKIIRNVLNDNHWLVRRSNRLYIDEFYYMTYEYTYDIDGNNTGDIYPTKWTYKEKE